MRFAPKTEKEVSEAGLLPKGTYDFEILEAEDKISSNMNEMIELKVAIFEDTGAKKIVFDYLLESMAYKLRHAAFATGLGDKYEMGELAAFDFVGKTGQAEIIIQKDKDKQYPDKNVIRDYVVPEASKAASSAAARPAPLPAVRPDASLNDEIPF